MQIYSSPALGLDLTHSTGSMGGGVGGAMCLCVRVCGAAGVGETRLLHIEN